MKLDYGKLEMELAKVGVKSVDIKRVIDRLKIDKKFYQDFIKNPNGALLSMNIRPKKRLNPGFYQLPVGFGETQL